MKKKIFLFITTFLAGTSSGTGYEWTDVLKGKVDAATFLDWFNSSEKYVHTRSLIILDLIPLVFLTIQAVLFFKDRKNNKSLFTGFAILANLIGVFLVLNYAYPLSSQIAGWKPDNLPSNWILVKDDWLKYIGLHGLLGLVGWLFFVITYFLPDRENTVAQTLPRFLNGSKNVLAFLLLFISGLAASRLYSYIFFPALYEISGTTFIEMHRPMDSAMRGIGPIIFTVMISCYVLLALLLFIEKSKYKGLLILAAIIFLIADTCIALLYNRPLNDLFLTWTPATIPANWSGLRDQWFSYHLYRNIFGTMGIIAVLLTHYVPKNKMATQAA